MKIKSKKLKPANILITASITMIMIFSSFLLSYGGKIALLSTVVQYLRFDIIAIIVNFTFVIALLRRGTADAMVDKERISKRSSYLLLLASAFLIPLPFILSVLLGFGIYNPWIGMTQLQVIIMLLQNNHVITILTFIPFIAYLIHKYNVSIAVVSTFFIVGFSEFYVAPLIAILYGSGIFLWWWPWYIAFSFMVFPFIMLVKMKKITIDRKYWIYLACTWWIEFFVFLPIMQLPTAWSWETHSFIANPVLADMHWTIGLTAFNALGIIRRIKDAGFFIFVKKAK